MFLYVLNIHSYICVPSLLWYKLYDLKAIITLIWYLGPPLLTPVNFNPIMEVITISSRKVDEIIHPIPNFNGGTIDSLEMDK